MKISHGLTRRVLLRQGAILGLAPVIPRIPQAWHDASATSPVTFTDVARQSGITFQHFNAATSEKYHIETMAEACGWIDYDQTGMLDLYLVTGAATRVSTPQRPVQSALYRNNGDGTFTDVTHAAGVGAEGLFGMGVAVGDYDNMTAFPTFSSSVTDRSHSLSQQWKRHLRRCDVRPRPASPIPRPMGFERGSGLDYDNDGKLDLVIANYVDWSPERNFYCGDRGPGLRSYCHPDDFHGQPPTLYHNNGDGTFTNVGRSSGVVSKPGQRAQASSPSITTMTAGKTSSLPTITCRTFYFTITAMALFAKWDIRPELPCERRGQASASGMGIDAADITGNGRLDLVVGHLDMQLARLYENLGDHTFEDVTLRSKIAYATYRISTFGARFMDYDNDGARDLFLANGHVLDNIELYHADTKYAEPKMMFRNTGHGVFENVSDRLGVDFQLPRVSRGAAIADFDNDGDLDILVNNCGQSPQLLRNDGGNANHWLEIFLIGTKSNRDGVGARVKVSAGDLVLHDQRKGGMSYQSAQDPRLHFGLGGRSTVDAIEVIWPSGAITNIEKLKSDQIITIKEGVGLVRRPFPRIREK